eukprot:COSAG02_NODE_1730_length_11179_cov_8.564350_4_plen_57_part_00
MVHVVSTIVRPKYSTRRTAIRADGNPRTPCTEGGIGAFWALFDPKTLTADNAGRWG